MGTKKHSFWGNLWFHFGHLWQWRKVLFLFTVLYVLAGAAGRYFSIWLPKLLLSLLEAGADIGTVIAQLGGLIICIVLATFGWQYANAELDYGRMFYGKYFTMLLNRKLMDLDYALLEDEKNQSAIHRAYRACSSDGDSVIGLLLHVPSFLATLLLILILGASVVLLDFRVLLVLAVDFAAFLVVSQIQSKCVESRQGECAEYHKKLHYILNVTGDFASGKDIRLFGMADWFRRIYAKLSDENTSLYREIYQKMFWYQLAAEAVGLFVNLAVYGFFIGGVLRGSLFMSDFVFVIGLCSGMQQALRRLVWELQQLSYDHMHFESLRGCLDIENRSNRGEGADLTPCLSGKKGPQICLKDVTFSYPGKERRTIEGISLTVEGGEKLGIVGANGVGKTTLIKLICGLYDCVQGEITVEGRPVSAYNRLEYFKLFSAVFQDVEVIPASIAQNVAMCSDEETDRQRVQECLRQAGLWEKVESLPEGMETKLVKSIYENAVDFSGGERQKLILARALYKDAPVLVLDEPTAALDPIAEDEVYRTYEALSRQKTSFFISHRLSSTRFCDRILYLEDGRIAEMGTHEQLLAMKGKYWNMFEVQSRYYREKSSYEG